MSPSVIKKFTTWIGPHDYNYSLIFAWIFIFLWAQARPFITSAGNNRERLSFGVEVTFVITSIVFTIVAYLFICMKLRANKSPSLRRYFLEIVGAAALSTLLTYFYNATVIPWSGRPQYLGPNDKPIIIFIRVIFCFLFIAATHELQRNLKEKLREAEFRNQILLDQYKVLIDADEEIRGQASRYLHDRVQSEIMLASTKLKKRVGELGHGQDEQITESIHQLEKIRSVDLKLVSQILTPNIQAEGIGGAIENLCKQYSSNFSYECQVSAEVENLDSDQLLGIFRIVEQAVINSITHGPAQKVYIKITSGIDGGFTIAVTDDGPGSDSAKTGTGTVIIDAWVSILKGRKEVKSNLGEGYKLLVTFPSLHLI